MTGPQADSVMFEWPYLSASDEGEPDTLIKFACGFLALVQVTVIKAGGEGKITHRHTKRIIVVLLDHIHVVVPIRIAKYNANVAKVVFQEIIQVESLFCRYRPAGRSENIAQFLVQVNHIATVIVRMHCLPVGDGFSQLPAVGIIKIVDFLRFRECFSS